MREIRAFQAVGEFLGDFPDVLDQRIELRGLRDEPGNKAVDLVALDRRPPVVDVPARTLDLFADLGDDFMMAFRLGPHDIGNVDQPVLERAGPFIGVSRGADVFRGDDILHFSFQQPAYTRIDYIDGEGLDDNVVGSRFDPRRYRLFVVRGYQGYDWQEDVVADLALPDSADDGRRGFVVEDLLQDQQVASVAGNVDQGAIEVGLKNLNFSEFSNFF